MTYEINKAKLVYFNRINITGNNKTRDKVIRRQLSVVEGDLYSRTKLKKSYMALNQLRYFEEVDFQSEKGPDETLTDVNIHVKEKPTGIFSIGAGYSALDHAVVSAQVSQQNLFGRGQILSLKASVGSSSTLYDLSFTEPWLFDMPLWSKLFPLSVRDRLCRIPPVGQQCEGHPEHGLLLCPATGGPDDEQRRHRHPDAGFDG
ncbi:MAG: BamA/TamA family outer membrane protein [Deltaproteobacteria bacterium]|nr:BamA/TamA family outer membrane protein [Deltaproteobacteria bacterium]